MPRSILRWFALGFCQFAMVGPAAAQNEQFIPVLTYRTGAYAVSGVPYANGEVDYYKLINARDGGINGVKILFEECETGYATDRGLECFERLKGKGPTGAAFVVPRSTGVAYALTERGNSHKIPVLTRGHGGAVWTDGSVFPWSFPLLGTYWSAADIAVQHIAKEIGGAGELKGKKIALLFHDSPYGKEPIPALLSLSQRHGFAFRSIPVPHPGLEQHSQWQSIRQEQPEYVLLWGWGVMNESAIKEAAAVGYPRDRMLGVWWSGSEADLRPVANEGRGYKALMLQHGSGKFPVHAEIERLVYAKGNGSGRRDEVGEVLYNRGLIGAMLGVEAIRKAQEKFGKKPLTGEQVRWGVENLELSEARLKELGFGDMIRPIKISCADHSGGRSGRVQQWDGTGWKVISDWYTADENVTGPIVKEVSAKYATERNITPRDCSKEG
jgi:branched-chain amino acid transport system substrate-binding protein